MSLQTVIRVEGGKQISGESSKPPGHVIENPSGTDSTQRNNLQFKDAHISDDSANSRTVVENLKPTTSSDFENETEEGFYYIGDEDEQPLTADDIPYNSTHSVGDMIDGFVNNSVKIAKYTVSTASAVSPGWDAEFTIQYPATYTQILAVIPTEVRPTIDWNTLPHLWAHDGSIIRAHTVILNSGGASQNYECDYYVIYR